MSIKLTFQDKKENTLYEKDLPDKRASVLPIQGDLVQLPGGGRAKVENRNFIYPDSEHGQTDLQIIFVCEGEKKYTTKQVRTKW